MLPFSLPSECGGVEAKRSVVGWARVDAGPGLGYVRSGIFWARESGGGVRALGRERMSKGSVLVEAEGVVVDAAVVVVRLGRDREDWTSCGATVS